ncbi:MAG: hypothetical protein K0Q95_1809 [Bacteroidota bacterium]|jgi:hypothetical protein|nr:hypothetical protein [Bacteroidota bacterium]
MNLKRLLPLSLLLLIIFAFNGRSTAQVKYFQGYVIMLNGDSLKGEIKKNLKREFDNFAKASFRKKDGAEIKSFGPSKIKEYCVDGTVFVSRNVEGEQVFVKRISKGNLSLYESQVEVMQMNDIKVKSDYYLEKAGGEFVKVKSSKFKKQMSDAMADNEEIVKALEEKKYDYENIVEVVNAYNKQAGN